MTRARLGGIESPTGRALLHFGPGLDVEEGAL